MAILTTLNLSFKIEEQVLFKNLNLSLGNRDKIGLIGRNGSGKTTLLRVLAGQLKPSSGELFNHGKVFYLAQVADLLLVQKRSVYEYIASQIENWWEVLDILKQKFDLSLNDDQLVSTLSGGELTKLNLAVGLASNPDTLLLDEPTNHLDLISMKQLIAFIKNFSGPVLISSHDTFFLDQITSQIWKIEDEGIKQYGGNYSSYLEQCQNELNAREAKYKAATKAVRKLKVSMQREHKRAERSAHVGRKIAATNDRSTDRFAKGFFTNKSQKVAGKQKDRLLSQMSSQEEKVERYKVKKVRSASFGINYSEKAKRKLVAIKDGKLKINSSLTLTEINLDIRNGDRIALLGSNGSGKTSLVKAIAEKDLRDVEGENVFLSERLSVAYIDQKYELVDRSLSILGNVRERNKDLEIVEFRTQLGNLLFDDNYDIEKSASQLSGGETARLAFAMVTLSPVDVLILDEPTNNLDIETVEAVLDALRNFGGAIIVISHSIDFLSKLEIDRSYIIKNGVFTTTRSSPSEKEEFFNEITSVSISNVK